MLSKKRLKNSDSIRSLLANDDLLVKPPSFFLSLNCMTVQFPHRISFSPPFFCSCLHLFFIRICILSFLSPYNSLLASLGPPVLTFPFLLSKFCPHLKRISTHRILSCTFTKPKNRIPVPPPSSPKFPAFPYSFFLSQEIPPFLSWPFLG